MPRLLDFGPLFFNFTRLTSFLAIYHKLSIGLRSSGRPLHNINFDRVVCLGSLSCITNHSNSMPHSACSSAQDLSLATPTDELLLNKLSLIYSGNHWRTRLILNPRCCLERINIGHPFDVIVILRCGFRGHPVAKRGLELWRALNTSVLDLPSKAAISSWVLPCLAICWITAR